MLNLNRVADLLPENLQTVSQTANYSEEVRRNRFRMQREELYYCINPTAEYYQLVTCKDIEEALAANKNSSSEDEISYEMIKHIHKLAYRSLPKYSIIYGQDGYSQVSGHAVILPYPKLGKDPTVVTS